MPLMNLRVSVSVPDSQKEALVAEVSKLLARATGKPEGYVMVTLDSATISMAGKPGPAAYADVRGIGGFNKTVNAKLSQELCALLKQRLAIEPDRVYLTCTDVAAQNWGWNGATFG